MDLLLPGYTHSLSNAHACLYTHTHIQRNTQPKAQITYRAQTQWLWQTNRLQRTRTHSSLGKRAAVQICPTLILGIWVALQQQQQIFPLLSSSLFSLPYLSEACPGSGRRGSAAPWYGQHHSIPLFPISLLLLQPNADCGEKWCWGGTLPVTWGIWNVNFATLAHLVQSGAVL